jgi:hypothetical protein
MVCFYAESFAQKLTLWCQWACNCSWTSRGISLTCKKWKWKGQPLTLQKLIARKYIQIQFRMYTYKLILSLLVLDQNKRIDTKHEDDAARGVWNKSMEAEVRKMVRFSVSHTFFLLSLGMCLTSQRVFIAPSYILILTLSILAT